MNNVINLSERRLEKQYGKYFMTENFSLALDQQEDYISPQKTKTNKEIQREMQKSYMTMLTNQIN